MRDDLPRTVDEIAAFMGVTLTADEHAAVVEQSTFAHMKSIGHKFEVGTSPWETGGYMMRRGERGKSGELLSAADQQRIDDYWRAELERIGSDFSYDETFAVGATPEGR
jgi:hypothetical protein